MIGLEVLETGSEEVPYTDANLFCASGIQNLVLSFCLNRRDSWCDSFRRAGSLDYCFTFLKHSCIRTMINLFVKGVSLSPPKAPSWTQRSELFFNFICLYISIVYDLCFMDRPWPWPIHR